MEEQSTFEARAVLAPRRARLSRLALLLPVVALAAIAWAGFNGPPADRATADVPNPMAVTPVIPRPQPPGQVLGIEVRRLDAVETVGLGRDEIVAVSGWYIPTAVDNCPPIAAIYRDGALPYVRGDADALAFCERSGVLYATPPDRDGRLQHGGLSAVPASMVIGVIAPLELEIVGSEMTQVVVIGRLVPSEAGCGTAAGCGRALVIDHIAWTPDA